MPVVNDFMIGADPEFVLLDPPNLLTARDHVRNPTWERVLYGFDHGGLVIEPHPDPNTSTRQVVKNIKYCLNQIARQLQDGTVRWRSGAYYQAPQRVVTLGGHVHVDKKQAPAHAGAAYDRFTDFLQRLEILPSQECDLRRNNAFGYGKPGDMRHEHGRFEYRSMCSWLFSQRTAMLCLTGIKLLSVEPRTLPTKELLTGMKDLKNWVEQFKGKDDDADWMLEKAYFDSDLTAKPDRDLKGVWRVDPENKEGTKPVEGFEPGGNQVAWWDQMAQVAPVDWQALLRGLPRGVRAIELIERDIRAGIPLTRDGLRGWRAWASNIM